MIADVASIPTRSIEVCRLSGRRYPGCEIDADMAEKAWARIAAVLPLGTGAPS